MGTGTRIYRHALDKNEFLKLLMRTSPYIGTMKVKIYAARHSLTAYVVTSIFTSLTYAQDAGVSASGLEEIVVEATRISNPLDRIPASISVVQQDEIQLGRQQLGLDEALNRVPGLFMQNRYNFSRDLRISIRGFGARSSFGIRGVKILVDGIPETLPDGSGQVDSIDLGATRQIEVIRGPSSSLYGNASGGVISIISEDGPEIPFFSARFAAGDHGFQKVQLKSGGETDFMNYFISLSDTQIEGYRAHSQAENTQFSGRFNFNLGEDRNLLAIFNSTDQPISNDPGGINAAAVAEDRSAARGRNVDYDTGETLNQQRVGFVFSTPAGTNGELTARTYVVSRDFTNKLPQFPVADSVNLQRSFIGGGLAYTHSSTLGGMPNRFIVGFDIDDQNDERKRFLNSKGILGSLLFHQDENFTSHGVFLQNELSLSERLQLNFGLRHDNVEYLVTDHFLSDGDDSGIREMKDASPMLGMIYSLSPTHSLYGTISTAFETPNTTDFANPSGGGGFNPTLGPQNAVNYEAGLRGAIGDRHYYELAVFDIKVDDELIPTDVDGRDFFENAGTSSRTGIEFALNLNPTDRIHTSLSYAFTDFIFDEYIVTSTEGGVTTTDKNYSGNIIPGTVEHLFFGEIGYTHPSGWFSALDMLYVHDQFADNANAVRVDGYTVANLRVGLERVIGSTVVSPFLGINNLFDTDYNTDIRINAWGKRYYEPAPGRNIYAGVTVRFDLL